MIDQKKIDWIIEGVIPANELVVIIGGKVWYR